MTMLDVSEVCRRLNLTQSTVRGLIKRGDLASYKFSRFVRVDEKDLEEFMERRRRRVEPRWASWGAEPKPDGAIPITQRRHRKAAGQ